MGWMIAVGVYAAALLAGMSVPVEAILAVFAASTLIVFVLARRLALLVVKYVANIVISEVDSELFGEVEDNVNEEELYLAWLLVDRIAREAAPGARRITLTVDAGDAHYSYPEPEELEDASPRNVEASGRVRAVMYSGGRLEILLAPDTVRRLARAVESGMGEKAVIRDEETLVAAYEIAKKAHKVAYGASDEIAAYAAYKAILRLVDSGVLEVDESLLEILPFEAQELRERILAQVKEEKEH